MNALLSMDHLQDVSESKDLKGIAALSQFQMENFQHLSKEDLLLAQTITGNGTKWGIWETPKEICPSRLRNHYRIVDLDKRIHQFLSKQQLPTLPSQTLDRLVEEGILVLTRLALLMRLAPTAGIGTTRTQRLKPSSLATKIYYHCACIVARAIYRKVSHPEVHGLFSALTEEDLQEFSYSRQLRTELHRLDTLAALGAWTDVPAHPKITRPTEPRGPKPRAKPQVVFREYQPISDRYLEEFGPRNLWMIREVGPRLLPLLEDLATHIENLGWSPVNRNLNHGKDVQTFIADHLLRHPWIDSMGRPLTPSFPLKTGAHSKDKFQFPPCQWEHLKTLSATLQSAQLFLTLLSTAGRVGEVANLPRGCVTTEQDGKKYVRGWTYKLSGNLFGDERTWPAPSVLVQALGQQARLAKVWIRLPPGNLEDGLPLAPPTHSALWLSLGVARTANAAEPLSKLDSALQMLAERIGMDSKPDGINLHPHRLRKTIGRLAGVALFNSPTVLKRLFGHKSIEMTLHYILCNKDIQTEAEAVLREMRVMHCAEALEEVRNAIASGSPLPAHGGAAVSRLADAVKEHEFRLSASGRIWKEGTAYDLAYLLTARGKGWRFVQKDIICAKVPGEPGLCLKNRGEPNTSNCKPGCDNRIVLAVARRDTDEIVQAYMDVSVKALEEEQFEVFFYSMGQLLKELENFHDIKEKYLDHAQLQLLIETYKELDQ